MARTRTVEDKDILEAARREFLARGHSTTTREIADAAGISQAVLYQRFASKDELFFAAMAPPSPDVNAIIGAGPIRQKDTEAYLIDLVDRLYHYFETVTPLFIQLGTHESFDPSKLATAHQPIVESALMKTLGGRFEDLADRGYIRGVEPAAATQLLVSMAHGEALAAALLNSPADLKRLQKMVRLIWRGLEPD